MGGKTIKNSAEKIAAVQLQSSVYGVGLPIQFGTNRGSGNLMWLGDFKAIPHTETTKAGKGFGAVKQENTTYTYTAAVMMALCEGPIAGIGTVWKGKDQATLGELGLTLVAGNPGQAAWSFIDGYSTPDTWDTQVIWGLTWTNPDYDPETPGSEPYLPPPAYVNQALGYDTTAYLAASAYDLGSDASIPNHGFEIKGFHIFGGGIPDADPKDVITSVLTSEQYGVGYTGGMLGDYTAFSDYCVASGLLISPRIEERQAASQHLQEWLDALNTDPLWSDGKLKLLPRGDVEITGNGRTFTPDLTPVYDLDDDSFTNEDGPVRIIRKTPADAFNRIQIEYNNRANQYNVEVVTVEDQDAIERYGLRPAQKLSMPFITDGAIAMLVAQIILQRSLYLRNEYEFDLTEAYALLEPGDLVTLTDAENQMDRVLVRLVTIDEGEEGYTCTAEDTLIGIANAALYETDSGLRFIQDFNITPGDPEDPFIFELPADPSATGLAIGIATGRTDGDLLYGGCNVWMSLDGDSYRQVGTINGSSRYGTLRAAFSNVATTMQVEMLSGGQLPSASAADADNAATLIAVGTEYLAYETSTLIDPDQYNLTDLVRGHYETTPASHLSGDKWVRVDDGVCMITNLDLSLIGTTVYFKLTAFNAYEGGEKDLADAAEYSYEITGYMEELGTKAQLAKIGEDGWLHPGEKKTVVREFMALTNEKSGLDAQADARGVSRVAYDTAYSALDTYLSGLSPDWDDLGQSTAVVRATWDTKWTDLYVAKQALVNSLTNGINTSLVYIYQRSASPPTLPSATTTYTYATGGLTGLNNGWTRTIPTADGNPLYVSVATAASSGPTDTIGSGEWTSAVVMSQDGATGSTGTAGINAASVFLYQRSASPPSVPGSTLTYTFATGVLSGTLGSWTQTIPSGSNPIYVTIATAAANTATDTIGTGEWQTPSVLAQNGADGAAGLNAASVFLYQRSASPPSVPGSTLTYTFATGALSGTLGSWTQTVPAGSNPLYVTTATAAASTATDTIATGEWATPTVMAQDGATGSTGTAGLHNALVYLFQRSGSAPSGPGSTLTYTFATGALSGTLGSWTQAVPAGSNPLYVTVATASSNTATDTIGTGEWTTPQIMAQDGATGAAGSNNAIVFLYQRGASGAPTLPSGSAATYTFSTGAVTGGTLNGWTTAIPASDGNPLYVTAQQASSNTSTASLPAGSWAAAVLKDGAGLNNATVTLFQRTATNSAPSGPGSTLTYTFSTGAVSGTLGSWAVTDPGVTSGAYLWVTIAVALGTGTTDTIGTGEWSTPKLSINANIAQIPNFTVIGTQSVTVIGNTAYKPSTTGHNAALVGDPRIGPQFTEMNIHTTANIYSIVCLDDAATGYTVASDLLVYFQYQYSTGDFAVYSNTTLIASGASTAGVSKAGKLRVEFDGTFYRFFIGDVEQVNAKFAASAPTLKLWPKWIIYDAAQTFTGLNAGSYTDRSNDGTRVTGLSDIEIKYDSNGSASTGELSRVETYRLLRNGAIVTTGLTWTYTVVSGTVSGFTSASGSQSLSGAGATNLTVSSLSSSEAVITIKCVDADGLIFLHTTRIYKNTATAPTGGSTGGGTAAQTSEFASFSSTSMTSVMPGTLAEFIVVAGSTSVALTASLDVESNASATTTSETFAIFQWWNGSSWVDVGTETASNPDVIRAQDALLGTWYTAVGGFISISTSKTGLTAGTTNRFRLMMRRHTSSAAATYYTTGSAGAQG